MLKEACEAFCDQWNWLEGYYTQLARWRRKRKLTPLQSQQLEVAGARLRELDYALQTKVQALVQSRC